MLIIYICRWVGSTHIHMYIHLHTHTVFSFGFRGCVNLCCSWACNYANCIFNYYMFIYYYSSVADNAVAISLPPPAFPLYLLLPPLLLLLEMIKIIQRCLVDL